MREYSRNETYALAEKFALVLKGKYLPLLCEILEGSQRWKAFSIDRTAGGSRLKIQTLPPDFFPCLVLPTYVPIVKVIDGKTYSTSREYQSFKNVASVIDMLRKQPIEKMPLFMAAGNTSQEDGAQSAKHLHLRALLARFVLEGGDLSSLLPVRKEE